jgi:hypothetical protein
MREIVFAISKNDQRRTDQAGFEEPVKQNLDDFKHYVIDFAKHWSIFPQILKHILKTENADLRGRIHVF